MLTFILANKKLGKEESIPKVTAHIHTKEGTRIRESAKMQHNLNHPYHLQYHRYCHRHIHHCYHYSVYFLNAVNFAIRTVFNVNKGRELNSSSTAI